MIRPRPHPDLRPRARALLVLAAAISIAACSVKLIDSYNKEAEEGLLRTYGKVESLYDALLQAEAPGARVYSRFADRYAEIHEMIRVQVLREGARPLNSESFGIISTIDTVFTRYREQHRRDTVYAEALLPRHRDNLRRMFGAALRAERVKQDQPDRE